MHLYCRFILTSFVLIFVISISDSRPQRRRNRSQHNPYQYRPSYQQYEASTSRHQKEVTQYDEVWPPIYRQSENTKRSAFDVREPPRTRVSMSPYQPTKENRRSSKQHNSEEDVQYDTRTDGIQRRSFVANEEEGRSYNRKGPQTFSHRPVQNNQDGSPKILFQPPRENIDFVFPEDTVTESNCSDYYCEGKPKFLNQTKIGNILNRSNLNVKNFFYEEEILEPVSVNTRIDTPDEVELCSSVQKVIYPTRAKNKEHTWVDIFQTEGTRQGVVVETCTNQSEDIPCKFSFPLGYKSFCRQKKIYRKLVAVDLQNESAFTDDFILPSCCVCVLKTVDLSSRSGSDIDITRQSPAKRNKNH